MCLNCVVYEDQTGKDILYGRARWEMTERNKRHAAYEEQVVMLLEHRVDMDEK